LRGELNARIDSVLVTLFQLARSAVASS
jgi:hypothetical protein